MEDPVLIDFIFSPSFNESLLQLGEAYLTQLCFSCLSQVSLPTQIKHNFDNLYPALEKKSPDNLF